MGKPVLDKITVVPKERPEDEQRFNLHLTQVNLHTQTRTIEDINKEIARKYQEIADLESLKGLCQGKLEEVERELYETDKE